MADEENLIPHKDSHKSPVEASTNPAEKEHLPLPQQIRKSISDSEDPLTILKGVREAETLFTQEEEPKDTLTDEDILAMTPGEYADYLLLLESTNNTKALANHLHVIVDRFKTDLSVTQDKDDLERVFLSQEIGQSTRTLLWMLTQDQDITVDPQLLDRLYSFIDDPSQLISYNATQYISSLVFLDNRQYGTDRFLNLRERYKDDLAYKLTHYTTISDTEQEGYNPETDLNRYNLETACHMVEMVFGDFPSAFPDILIRALNQTEDPTAIKVVLNRIGNRIGYNQARKMLRHYATRHSDFRPKYELVENIIKDATQESITPDLRDIYGAIKFEDYKPNEELNDYETTMLLEEIMKLKAQREIDGKSTDIKTLDIGAGTGRLMFSLKAKGQDVVGFDLMKNHAEYIKQQDPNAKIVQGSWENTWDDDWNAVPVSLPFKDQAFDFAYCYGRTVLHNTTEEDWIDFFAKANRVLKPDGVLMVDTADPTVGDYAENIQAHRDRTDNLRIVYTSAGSINDGPDAQHTFDRLVPSQEQFVAMAAIAGFDAEMVATQEYHGATDERNKNIYWKLTKLQRKLTIDEKKDFLRKAYTSSPPLFV